MEECRKIRSSIAHSCSPAAKKSLRVRNPLLEKMEMMLLTWMEDQKGKKMTVNTTAICAKAQSCTKSYSRKMGVLQLPSLLWQVKAGLGSSRSGKVFTLQNLRLKVPMVYKVLLRIVQLK